MALRMSVAHIDLDHQVAESRPPDDQRMCIFLYEGAAEALGERCCPLSRAERPKLDFHTHSPQPPGRALLQRGRGEG